MPLSQAEVQGLVEQALHAFEAAEMQHALLGLLIAPERHDRRWEHGSTPETIECWIVARFPDGWGIGYSNQGHGPQRPWGLVACEDSGTGQDSNWFATLEEAFHESGECDAMGMP